jgi:hypothetical protein
MQVMDHFQDHLSTPAAWALASSLGGDSATERKLSWDFQTR